jgi:hypothetical protein
MDASIRIVPITDLRRKFGEITENLAGLGEIILTKDGRPFAVLRSAVEEKRKRLLTFAGMWKSTEMDDKKMWKEILARKSSKAPVKL